MNSFQKKLTALVAVLTAVAVTMAACLFYSVEIAPDAVTVTTMVLSDDRIPASMQDVSIVYFTDLEYGKFETDERAQALFDRIRTLNPSVLVFGGDLFDRSCSISSAQTEKMVQWIASIPAPLGKFAVLGEMDVISSQRLDQVRQVYAAAQVEVLENSNVRLGNFSKAGIGLAGISTQPDFGQAFAGLASDQFNLLVSHYTDPLTANLAAYPISQALCGNSHGTQITWPFFGGYRLWKGSEVLNRADRMNLDFPYYISSGTGCTEIDARFNAPVEVVYILLGT